MSASSTPQETDFTSALRKRVDTPRIQRVELGVSSKMLNEIQALKTMIQGIQNSIQTLEANVPDNLSTTTQEFGDKMIMLDERHWKYYEDIVKSQKETSEKFERIFVNVMEQILEIDRQQKNTYELFELTRTVLLENTDRIHQIHTMTSNIEVRACNIETGISAANQGITIATQKIGQSFALIFTAVKLIVTFVAEILRLLLLVVPTWKAAKDGNKFESSYKKNFPYNDALIPPPDTIITDKASKEYALGRFSDLNLWREDANDMENKFMQGRLYDDDIGQATTTETCSFFVVR